MTELFFTQGRCSFKILMTKCHAITITIETVRRKETSVISPKALQYNLTSTMQYAQYLNRWCGGRAIAAGGLLQTPIGPLPHLESRPSFLPFQQPEIYPRKLKKEREREENSLLESCKQGRPQEDVKMENVENHCSKFGKNQVRIQTQLYHLSL